MDDFSNYLTVKEVARKLGVTEDWIRDLIQAKELKATKIKQWRIKAEDLDEFIESRKNV